MRALWEGDRAVRGWLTENAPWLLIGVGTLMIIVSQAIEEYPW